MKPLMTLEEIVAALQDLRESTGAQSAHYADGQFTPLLVEEAECVPQCTK
jgi:hypothetical protein